MKTTNILGTGNNKLKKLLVQLLLLLCILAGIFFQTSLMNSNRGQAMAIYEAVLLLGVFLISITYLVGYLCYRYLKNKHWMKLFLAVQIFILYCNLKRYYYYEFFEEIKGNPYLDEDHYAPGYVFYITTLVIHLLLFICCVFQLKKNASKKITDK